MVESKGLFNLLLPEDPPLENAVLPLTVSLDEIKKEEDLLDYSGVGEPSTYPVGESGVAGPPDVKLDDIKTEIPQAYPIGEPGCSRWSVLGVKSSTKIKREVLNEECSSSSSSLHDGKIPLDMEDMSSSIKSELEDIEMKTEEEPKQEELELNECETGFGTSAVPTISKNFCGIIEDVTSGLSNNSSEECQNSILKNHIVCKDTSTDKIKIFFCADCEYQTKYKGTLKSHILTHKSDDKVEIFHCTDCEYKTKYKGNLRKHIIKHNIDDKVEIFNCADCEYTTKYKANLARHIVSHKSDDEVEIFRCTFCKYKTKYLSNMRSHIVVKHKSDDEVEIFRCTLCEYQTKNKRNLINHIVVKHKSDDEVEIFDCTICGYKTRSKRYFNSHVIRRHKRFDKVEIFQCTFCEYKAKKKNDLDNHIKCKH